MIGVLVAESAIPQAMVQLIAIYLLSLVWNASGGRLWDCCCRDDGSVCMPDTVPQVSRPNHKVLMVQITQDNVVACASALWAWQLDLDFVQVSAESSRGKVECSGALFETIAYWLEHAQQHIEWIGVLTEHVLPLGALANLQEKLEFIAGHGHGHGQSIGDDEVRLAQIVALSSPPTEIPGESSQEIGTGLWFIRRGPWSQRIFNSLRREVATTPSKDLCLSDIVRRLVGRMPNAVAIHRTGEWMGLHDGTLGVPETARAFFVSGDYPASVRSEVSHAALEQLCHNTDETDSALDEVVRNGAFIDMKSIYSSLISSLHSWLLDNSTRSRDTLKLVQILDANGRRVEAVAVSKAALENIMSPRDVPELLVRAFLYRAVGEYDSAHSDCHRASFTETYRQAALPCMSDALQNLGRFEEAMPLMKESLTRAAAAGEKDAAAAAIASLASTHASEGRLPEAERFANRALKIRQEELSENHPNIAASLMVLADVWRLQNRRSESLQALTQALEIQRDALPEDHPEIGSLMNNLGYLLMEEQRYQESVSALKEALGITLRAMGPKHDGVVGTLLNLAAVHEFSNDVPAAERVYERLAQIRSKGDRKFHDGQWMGRYGKLLYKEGRHEEALDRLRGALTIWRDLRHTPNAETFTIAGTIGAVLHGLQRHEEAVEVLTGVAAVQEQSSSQSSPQSAQTLANLGVALHAMGRTEEALALLRRSESTLIELLSESSPQVIAARQNIAAIERAQHAEIEEPPLVRFDDPDDVAVFGSDDSDMFVYDGW